VIEDFVVSSLIRTGIWIRSTFINGTRVYEKIIQGEVQKGSPEFFEKRISSRKTTQVGTDSHTTKIDALGIAGWGVGGIEAEAVMLGQSITMVLPEVVGFKFTGTLQPSVVATDLVLTVVNMLRKLGKKFSARNFFVYKTISNRLQISIIFKSYERKMREQRRQH
jgi:hypothetical protein